MNKSIARNENRVEILECNRKSKGMANSNRTKKKRFEETV